MELWSRCGEGLVELEGASLLEASLLETVALGAACWVWDAELDLELDRFELSKLNDLPRNRPPQQQTTITATIAAPMNHFGSRSRAQDGSRSRKDRACGVGLFHSAPSEVTINLGYGIRALRC